ncbi:PEP-CTERM sorting domain-containing protein [Tunturiibacter gelidiferens]|uniref:PEP-CTERM sorting domain-containing protein n=1 Tax=Tunturiibacter gelidiferens TaxID=3069689 RepID=UPI003D9B3445
MFTPGTYQLGNSAFEPNGPGTLVIDGSPSPVPEASTLVLLGIGLLGGFEVIRRKTVCS